MKLMLIFSAVSVGLTACLMGGGGSDTEISSAQVTGKIRTLDGLPATHAKVWLIPSGYRSWTDSLSSLHSTQVDAQGNYQFKKVDSGTYNLEASDPKAGTRLMIRNIYVGKDVKVAQDTLRTPGSISMRLPDSLALQGGAVYIPGKLGVWNSDQGQTRVIMDSLPLGLIPQVRMLIHSQPPVDLLLAESLSVIPSDTLWEGPYALWKHKAKILINSSLSGEFIQNNVYDVPLLLRLSSSDLDFNQVGIQGTDLRFTKANGNPVPFSIQSWDAPLGQANIWIRIDTVFKNQNTQFLKMHWGREGAKTVSDSKSVFDSAVGYVGMWHLDGTVSGPLGVLDVSGSANHANWSGSTKPLNETAGLIGTAQVLNGKDENIVTAKAYAPPDVFTYSLWFKTKSLVGGKLLDYSNPKEDTLLTTHRDYDRQLWMDSTGRMHFGIYRGWGDSRFPLSETKTISSTGIYNDDVWHCAVASLSPRGQEFYLDGVLIGLDPTVTSGAQFLGRWTMGSGSLNDWSPFTSTRYFEGALDEIQILHQYRSPDWVKLVYANQKMGSLVFRVMPFSFPN